MIRNCNNCEKEYEAKTSRSKYCSKACKLAWNRNNQDEVTVSRSVSNDTQTQENDTQPAKNKSTVSSAPVEAEVTVSFTRTDQLFQDDAIARGLGENWLSFSEIVRQPTCNHCKKKFKTRLPLLRYCSPKCRTTELEGVTR